jgi:hypothetical protein
MESLVTQQVVHDRSRKSEIDELIRTNA